MTVTETARVKIREFVDGDVQVLSGILSDPDVMEFSGKGPLNEAETMGFIEWCIKSYQDNGYGPWAVLEKESGKLIGSCGLSHTTLDGDDQIELGYRLGKEQWGKGLASEAASGALAHAFDTCMIDTVVGIVSPRHRASIRVLEKVGFRSFFQTNFYGWYVRVYRLSQEEWESYNTLTSRWRR